MLMGQLRSFSLESLLQICYSESNTGAIDFFKHGILCGKIGFEKGAVISAEFLGMNGIPAVKQLALLADIDFEYHDGAPPAERNVETDINFLTIECSRYKDECLEYLSQVSELFSKKYPVEQVSFYDYDSPFFYAPGHRDVRYFESAVNDQFVVVYLDKKIHSRIKIEFKESISSDSLLIFLEDKNILK